MGLASVSFPGINTALGGEMTLTRGVKPSVCTLYMVPQDNLVLAPGTLTFHQDGVFVQFADALLDTGYVRMQATATRQRWAVQIADRRWRWQFTTIDGEYNVRLPDGTVDESEKKNPQELAAILLTRLGAAPFDVSGMPTSVWPYVRWVGKNAADALQELCDYVACAVVLGTDNVVRVVALGTGTTEGALETGRARHQRFRLPMRRRPLTIAVTCGPTRYQAELATEAIGREQEGDQHVLDSLLYAPVWEEESPWNFPSITDDDDRAAAFDSVWRWYRVSGVSDDDNWTVPGSPTSVSSLKQLLPFYPDLIDTGEDLDNVKRTNPPFIKGEFWAYGDGPNNTDEEIRYTGPFQLQLDRGVAVFPWPVFKLDADQYLLEAELKLTASFNVRSEDGELDRIIRAASGGGLSGVLNLSRHEIFAAISSDVNTVAQAQAEADAYLAMFQQKYSGPLAQEREHASILNFQPDGRIAAVKWSCAKNRNAITRVSYRDDFEVYA
jgi:hypothetical protein